MSARLRACIISSVYLEPTYRAVLRRMAASVDLTLVSPNQFAEAHKLYRADFAAETAFVVRVFPIRYPLFVRTSTRWDLVSRDLGMSVFSPDIIHIENEGHSFIVLQALLCRLRFAPRAKVVISFWGNLPLVGPKGRLTAGLGRLMRPGIDAYIAASQDGKRLLVDSGVPANLVSVFPSTGVDTGHFAPAKPEQREALRAEFGYRADQYVIGFVGRFVEEKGLSDLIAAFDVLREVYGDQVRLLCVGQGPFRTQLLSRSPAVSVVAAAGPQAMPPFYQVMDTLVVPSRTSRTWKEQFGRVLVEAMACGIPVVGSDSGAIPEVIGDAGLTFPEGNTKALTARLKTLLECPALRAQYKSQGHFRAQAEYSAELIAAKNLNVYQQVCAGQS